MHNKAAKAFLDSDFVSRQRGNGVNLLKERNKSKNQLDYLRKLKSTYI